MDNNSIISTTNFSNIGKQKNKINKSPIQSSEQNNRTGLGKNTFLKLLITELRHQDPTQPMKDREFISQMAQFSALEQMTNLNSAIQNLSKSAKIGEAYPLLGKNIEAFNPVTGKKVTGIVSKIFYKDSNIQLLVGREQVTLSDIHAIYPAEMDNSREKSTKSDTGINKNQLGAYGQ